METILIILISALAIGLLIWFLWSHFIKTPKKDDQPSSALQNQIKSREIEIATLKEQVNQFRQNNLDLHKENTAFKQGEDNRRADHEKRVANLNSTIERIQDERNKEIEDKHKEEIEKISKLKETWSKHEDKVKEKIKAICQKHVIEYVDKVPFRGNPDNALKIIDEYIVFDAKSPASDNLENFPTYIKSQTESVKKYIKEENVKKDIFLVIPSNTVDTLDKFSFNMADYNVYVVTLDALEPIILSLQKIEEYEFVEQLSPEERDNICRLIGKFAHVTKRRIQIDQFFGQQFLNILSKCEDLPRDVLKKVLEYEQSEKLNPPQEKRAKLISGKELEDDGQRIKREAEAKEIAFPTSLHKTIESLPLNVDDRSINTNQKDNKKH